MIGIFSNLFRSSPIVESSRSTPLTPDQAMQKMRNNAEKAILEPLEKKNPYSCIGSCAYKMPSKELLKQRFGSILPEMLPTKEILEKKEITPLNLKHTFADHIGPRPQMEDAHIFVEIEQGTLLGVFDGHGGKEVSTYASQEFQKRFSSVLKAHNGDVFRAFEVLIHEIHQEVAQKPQWNNIGSTAVISFIDKATHQIITATLGDSEANIYRGEKSIPLSTIRDWTCKKDEARLINAHGQAAINHIECDQYYNGYQNPKGIRSRLDKGVNVSRAIGDVNESGTKEKPIVIHKPKITINKLQKGDVLVLACDGLKDYVPESEIAATVVKSKAESVNKNAWTIGNIAKWVFNWIMTTIFCRKSVEEGIALDLVNHAIYDRIAKDNVTVIAVEVS